MDRYMPKDITTYAKKEAEAYPAISVPEQPARNRTSGAVPGQIPLLKEMTGSR